MRKLIFVLAFALLAVGRAELIPAARLGDWSAVGVPGGIPTNRTNLIDVTQAPYNADNTGATNAATAINAAISAAAPGDVVYCPPGTYRLTSAIGTGYKDNITLRGAGPTQTIFEWHGSGPLHAMRIGSESNYTWNWPNPKIQITGSPVRGTSTVTVSATAAIASYAGALCRITLDDDTSRPVVHVTGYAQAIKIMAVIESVNTGSGTVTFTEPLPIDLPAGLNPVLTVAGENAGQDEAKYVGFEDFRLNAVTGLYAGIGVTESYGCWVKNVMVYNVSNYALKVDDSYRCEFRLNYLDQRQGGGTNGAGLLMAGSTRCLFEDNIVDRHFPALEINFGCVANVFAYNACFRSESYGVLGVTINSNHGPHNAFNLYEGNYAPKFQSDGYFGSNSDETL